VGWLPASIKSGADTEIEEEDTVPQYLVRKNCNGFVLREAHGLREFVSDTQALDWAEGAQTEINERFLHTSGRRMPCPSVEVFRFVGAGVPARVGKRLGMDLLPKLERRTV
jgi:hypothetical protein